jgi:hypothetical protein
MAQHAIATDGASIDLRSDGSASPNEHAHIYETEADGMAYTIITDDHAPVPSGEAAALLDVPEDQVSWTLTVERDASEGTPSGAIPCAECERPVWMPRERAERDRHDETTIRCGSCAGERDNA